MSLRRIGNTFLLLILLGAFAPSRARGDEIQKKMDGLAQSLSGLLSQRNESKIAVGEFFGARALNASAGPAIAQALTDALARKKIANDDQASLEIRGEYFLKDDALGTSASLKIKFQVFDTNAGREEVAKPEMDLFEASTVARLTGATGDISGNNNRERLKKVRQNIKNPQVEIDKSTRGEPVNSRVSVPGKPYAVEVLVKSGTGYVARAAESHQNKAFVALQRDEVYAVRLINNSPLDAAVELCIDGINVFSLHRDPRMRSAKIIIPPGETDLIRGFVITDDDSREFLLAGIDVPVDGPLLPKGNPSLGTITAQFAASWPEGTAPPSDEPSEPITEGADDNRTIPGTVFRNQIRRLKVEIGKPRAQISIRYNKPAN
jgi:hypothetical protein